MGEQCPARILIGGQLAVSLVEQFIEEIRDNGAGPDWDGVLPAEVKTSNDLMGLVNAAGHLELMDSQASWGNFDQLEDYCKAHGLSFDRHTRSHYGEWDAHWTAYRPAQGEFAVQSDNEGSNFVDANRTLKAYLALKRGDIHSALDLLTRTVGWYGDIAPLPPFTIKG